MEYVTFVTLVDFEAQRNRAFVFPLHTACGLFKLTIRKKGLSLVAAVELSAPTFNGSEQFPWLLSGVMLQLRLLNAPGHRYSGNWTFSTISRTWITEYMSCAELYKPNNASAPNSSTAPQQAAAVVVSSNKMIRQPHRGRASSRRSVANRSKHAIYTITPAAHHVDAGLPAAAAALGNSVAVVSCPPTFEVRLIIKSPSIQIFSISDDALIHTSAKYTYIHRAIHCLLLSNLFLNSSAPNKEIQELLREFSTVSHLSSHFYRLVESLVRADSRILFEDCADTFRAVVSQLVESVDNVLRVTDWEGDPFSLLDIMRSFSSNLAGRARLLLLRLNGESGYLKTLMRRVAIDIPVEIELSPSLRYSCIGAFLSMSRHELCYLRSSYDGEWVRVTDHGYSGCVIRDYITCHKRLLPTCLIYMIKEEDRKGGERKGGLAKTLELAKEEEELEEDAAAVSSTAFAYRCTSRRFARTKSLSCGIAPTGGLALSSTHGIESSVPRFELTSHIRAVCVKAYYGVIPWQRRSLDDLNALEEILKLCEGGAANVVGNSSSEDGNGSGSTSASSEICRFDRSVSWFRLASLYYKHIGYQGILWADTLIHTSPSCPTLWPPGVSERLFWTRASPASSHASIMSHENRSRQQRLKRKTSFRISLADFTKLTPAGKRRRLPRETTGELKPLTDEAATAAVRSGRRAANHRRAEGLATETDLEQPIIFQSSERWFAVRLILSNILHSIFERSAQALPRGGEAAQWPPPMPATSLAPIRLSFEFDPNYAYDLLLPRDITTLDFRQNVIECVQECQTIFASWSTWTGWEDIEKGSCSLWRRHGTTWRQILTKVRLRQQVEHDVDAQEVLIIFHPGDTQPTFTETLLDVVYLEQFTFEPVHIGYVTSLCSQTVGEIYTAKIESRLSIHRLEPPPDSDTPRLMPNCFSCMSTDGTPILETFPVKKLRMSQGALVFSIAIPINIKPTKRIAFHQAHSRRKKRIFFKGFDAVREGYGSVVAEAASQSSATAAPPEVESNRGAQAAAMVHRSLAGAAADPRRRKKASVSVVGAAASSTTVSSAEIRLLESSWGDFISGGQTTNVAILATLMRKYKARAARYIDQIRTIDARMCQLIANCGEALLPSMCRTRSASRRLAQSMRGTDSTVAQTLVTKLQNCLLAAASNFDHDLCRQCINALHVVDFDQHNDH